MSDVVLVCLRVVLLFDHCYYYDEMKITLDIAISRDNVEDRNLLSANLSMVLNFLVSLRKSDLTQTAADEILGRDNWGAAVDC